MAFQDIEVPIIKAIMNHREILNTYGIRAKKSLGQNFLVNDEILEAIVESIDITGHDIIEIGPGYGALTTKILAKHPKSLTLIELDREMVSILRSRVSSGDIIIPQGTDFSIVETDVLKYIPWNQDYTVIANIPYYITSPILFRFLHELEYKPHEMLILMQKEVGDKILRKKGYHNSYLSLAMEYATEEIREVLSVPRENFIPAPKVDSSVLYFQSKKEYDKTGAKKFLSIVSAGFLALRKKLISNLASRFPITKEQFTDIFKKLGLSETVRAEELDIALWVTLLTKIGKGNIAEL